MKHIKTFEAFGPRRVDNRIHIKKSKDTVKNLIAWYTGNVAWSDGIDSMTLVDGDLLDLVDAMLVDGEHAEEDGYFGLTHLKFLKMYEDVVVDISSEAEMNFDRVFRSTYWISFELMGSTFGMQAANYAFGENF